ncbi:MAG: N-6 DNA methylase [Deltaproteobacteria bacterium]|nr:N-6 DNA methylase [Deltaproteobacteria bacterium]
MKKFREHEQVFRSDNYNEMQLRREFLDPFFTALGWDMAGSRGRSPVYQDVIHEESIKIGETWKAPDLTFRIGGVRKFFVEAKRPLVNVKESSSGAYQLRRYAWSHKLSVSILTNFEEFAVYNCRVKPEKNDKASRARFMFVSYVDYIDRWDEIQALFSRDAVRGGALERGGGVEKYVKKDAKGTELVDEAFLVEIEGWRHRLALSIFSKNKGLTQAEINFSVQRTIDRIIFLRICEDRGIEPYGRLRSLVESSNIYGRLMDHFRRADDRYNSGLFHFSKEPGRHAEPDGITPGLRIEDGVLSQIIRSLYYPDSPYEFSVMPAEILGQVYEQFLGNTIVIRGKVEIVVEQKPEVRKAGGVYYTPAFIVDYMIGRTLRRWLEGKTPTQISGMTTRWKPAKQGQPLRIVDPACGSGSFLIACYQTLLEWYRAWYSENQPELHCRGRSPKLFEHYTGELRLTMAERKRILLCHIFGVDIDPQAVEVAKLSLLLKALEGENEQTLEQQFEMFHERALPDLGENIRCGNSLVAPDIYGERTAFGDMDRRMAINAFDWQCEFEDAAMAGGFDIVVGNPPYGIVFDSEIKRYLEVRYKSFVRNNEIFTAFVQRGVELIKSGGMLSYILPNTFLLGPYYDAMKTCVLQKSSVEGVVDFGTLRVFKPNVFTCLLFLSKGHSYNDARYRRLADFSELNDDASVSMISSEAVRSLRWVPSDPVFERLSEISVTVGDVAWVKDVGLNYWTKGRGKKRGGSIADRVFYEGDRAHRRDMRYLKGRDIERYCLTPGERWLRHDYEELLDPDVDTFRFSAEFLRPVKIVYRQTADRIIAAIDGNGHLVDKTVHAIVVRDEWRERVSLHYLLGVLNSKLMLYYYRALSQEEGRDFAQVKIFRVRLLPLVVPSVNPRDAATMQLVESVAGCAQRIEQLTVRSRDARLDHERTVLQRQIIAHEQKIDRLVYKIYGLSDEETKTIEAMNATGGPPAGR